MTDDRFRRSNLVTLYLKADELTRNAVVTEHSNLSQEQVKIAWDRAVRARAKFLNALKVATK